jgi:hypothetical protein
MPAESAIRGRIAQSLEASGCRDFLRGVLSEVESADELIRFVHRYTVFNGDFAAGVASLAGAFHVRQDLFRADDEAIPSCADRSADVASYIFFAAEDEYSVRGGGPRWTHRGLGQVVLRETLVYFGLSPERFAGEFNLGPTMQGILAETHSGYRVGEVPTEEQLFAALGFHIGAELLADVEFNVIHEHLVEHHRGYVDHLLATDIGHGLNAYHWVQLHTSVEAEHFDAAVVSADKALEYYAGPRDAREAADEIVTGFEAFLGLQRRFFANALSPSA